MKYLLRIAAVVLAIMVALVILATFTHFGDRRERVGHFDVYTSPRVPDSSARSALYYKRHLLTENVNSYALDPNNPDRILFTSSDVFHGIDIRIPCGTFLYEGRSKQLTRIRRWPAAILWSPNSQFILLDRGSHATVLELSTGKEVDVTDSVSKIDGSRVWMTVLQWSPDSQQLAAEITDGWGGDLIEITLASLSVKYIATIDLSWRSWTDTAIRWSGGELQVAIPDIPERHIVVKPQEALGWTTAPPIAPPRRSQYEDFCAPEEPSGR
jgi:hypothetical protein